MARFYRHGNPQRSPHHPDCGRFAQGFPNARHRHRGGLRLCIHQCSRLPDAVSAEVSLLEGRHEAMLNTIEFRDYRRFGSNVKILNFRPMEKP
jgi:hypothetical protein